MFWMGGRLREIPTIGFWEGNFGVLDEWSLTRDSNYRVLSGKIWCFGWVVAYERFQL